MSDLFRGEMVRLSAPDPERDSADIARWRLDTEFTRLVDTDPAYPLRASLIRAQEEKEGIQPSVFPFAIHTLADDRHVGFVGLFVFWLHGDALVGIGIGDSADRGRGYGTDAMRLILGYAFTELNLFRVSLSVFADNPRAIRAYQKAGFRLEGRVRQEFMRDGRRRDVLYMGILNSEWRGIEAVPGSDGDEAPHRPEDAPLVRLAAPHLEAEAETLARWMCDSEYARLMDSDPARLYTPAAARAWLQDIMDDPANVVFSIRTRAEDRLIGWLALDGIQPAHAESWVGLGIGEREYWGRGYGSQALRLALGYAFTELNLQRVSLSVFEYNTRAVRAYQKIGFQLEGRQRQRLARDGRRWDMLIMGLLREEWVR